MLLISLSRFKLMAEGRLVEENFDHELSLKNIAFLNSYVYEHCDNIKKNVKYVDIYHKLYEIGIHDERFAAEEYARNILDFTEKDGKPSIRLKNNELMNISNIHFQGMTGKRLLMSAMHKNIYKLL